MLSAIEVRTVGQALARAELAMIESDNEPARTAYAQALADWGTSAATTGAALVGHRMAGASATRHPREERAETDARSPKLPAAVVAPW